MLITDQFVFIHQPKTGGTFVTKIVKDLHCPSRFWQKVHSAERRWGVSLPIFPRRYRELAKHSMAKHIPARFSHLPLVSCIRNPFDIYVSQFKFDWWRSFPDRWFTDAAAVRAEFGDISEFDFRKFVLATIKFNGWCRRGRESSNADWGYYSTEWTHYFSHQPRELRMAFDAAPEAGWMSVRPFFVQTEFLHTETLSADLHAYLLAQGYSPDRIAHVAGYDRILPGKQTRPKDDSWREYYDQETLEIVARAERLLLMLFPEYATTWELESATSA